MFLYTLKFVPSRSTLYTLRKEFARYTYEILTWGFAWHLNLCSYVQHLSCIRRPIFPRHGDSRVRMKFNVHQSYIFEVINFKLKWILQTSVKISEWKLAAPVAFLFRVFGYASKKGKNKLAFKPFNLRDLNWDCLPDCMWPGLDPNKEVHESVGGLLVSLSLILEIFLLRIYM